MERKELAPTAFVISLSDAVVSTAMTWMKFLANLWENSSFHH